jgi:hypothetical protein
MIRVAFQSASGQRESIIVRVSRQALAPISQSALRTQLDFGLFSLAQKSNHIRVMIWQGEIQ